MQGKVEGEGLGGGGFIIATELFLISIILGRQALERQRLTR